MVPKLIIVIGLPGSGKTYYLKSLVEDNKVGRYFDDFHAKAQNNSPRFDDSRHKEELLNQLKDGVNCGVADIAFCEASRRGAFIKGISKNIDDVQIEYHCFKNDPETCRINVLDRNRGEIKKQLAGIDEFSSKFDIPKNSKLIPVYSKNSALYDL